MTDRLTKGDRVIVVNPDERTHNRTGVIAIDDRSNLPYFVEFDDPAQRPASEWYREMDLAPATYRPIAPGEHVPECADVFIPAGLASRHGYTGGARGARKTFSAIDDDGDLPVMLPTPPDGNQLMWFPATDCYINTPARKYEVGDRVVTRDHMNMPDGTLCTVIETRHGEERPYTVMAVNDDRRCVSAASNQIADPPADAPRRPAEGDRVRINAPGEEGHNRVGTVTEDDHTSLPFFVVDETGHRYWYFEDQVTVVEVKDTGLTVPVSDEARAEGETSNAKEAPEPGQAIRVLRRHVIVLDQPVSSDDLARAARALEPGMRVSVRPYSDRMEVVGTDPEDDRG